MFGLLKKYFPLIQVELSIPIIIVMAMSYEGTLVSLWCAYSLLVNDTKSFGNSVT